MLHDVSAAIPWRQPDELQCTCMRQGGNLTRSEWEEPRDTAHHQLSPDSRQQSMQRPAQLPDDTQQQETNESTLLVLDWPLQSIIVLVSSPYLPPPRVFGLETHTLDQR